MPGDHLFQQQQQQQPLEPPFHSDNCENEASDIFALVHQLGQNSLSNDHTLPAPHSGQQTTTHDHFGLHEQAGEDGEKWDKVHIATSQPCAVDNVAEPTREAAPSSPLPPLSAVPADYGKEETVSGQEAQTETAFRRRAGTTKEPRSFKCKVCSDVFTRKSSLKRHIQAIHNNEKPFICKFNCGYRTNQKANLKRHEFVHLTREVSDNRVQTSNNQHRRFDGHPYNFGSAGPFSFDPHGHGHAAAMQQPFPGAMAMPLPHVGASYRQQPQPIQGQLQPLSLASTSNAFGTAALKQQGLSAAEAANQVPVYNAAWQQLQRALHPQALQLLSILSQSRVGNFHEQQPLQRPMSAALRPPAFPPGMSIHSMASQPDWSGLSLL